MFPGLSGIKNTTPFTNATPGGNNNMVGSIATQNLGGDSLTQMMRSLQNYLATQGQSTFNTGADMTTAGAQGFGTAGTSTGTAMDTSNKALATLDPSTAYWTKLLSGDQNTMNQAVAPYATQVGTNIANATTNAQQNSAKGGYAAAQTAGMPFAQSQLVNNALMQLQPTAAAGLNTNAGTVNNVAGTQGNIAGIQGQLANWLASLGVNVSSLGANLLGTANNSLMTGRGQDVNEHNNNVSAGAALGGDLMRVQTP